MKRSIFILVWIVLAILTSGFTLAAAELPGELNNILRPYPGARVIHTMSMRFSTMATIEVSDEAQSVLEFYRKELSEKGWDISVETGQENQPSIFARKGASALVMDTRTDNTGKTLVNFTFTGQ